MELATVLRQRCFPMAMQEWITLRKKTVAYTFVLADTSRSMRTRDGHELIIPSSSDSVVSEAESCTRWKELGVSVETMISIADAAQTPVEVSLLNTASSPVVVGKLMDGGASLEAARTLLRSTPTGQTPICAKVRYVVSRLKGMKADLRKAAKVALVILLTDGESTDGDAAEAMKPLEALPCKVIIRVCTTETAVTEVRLPTPDPSRMQPFP